MIVCPGCPGHCLWWMDLILFFSGKPLEPGARLVRPGTEGIGAAIAPPGTNVACHSAPGPLGCKATTSRQLLSLDFRLFGSPRSPHDCPGQSRYTYLLNVDKSPQSGKQTPAPFPSQITGGFPDELPIQPVERLSNPQTARCVGLLSPSAWSSPPSSVPHQTRSTKHLC